MRGHDCGNGSTLNVSPHVYFNGNWMRATCSHCSRSWLFYQGYVEEMTGLERLPELADIDKRRDEWLKAQTATVAMTPVQSSNIAEVGYDEAAGELHVRFKMKSQPTHADEVGGVVTKVSDTYIYPGVSPAVYKTMLGGDVPYNFSVGKHFDKFVKKVVDPKLVKMFHRPRKNDA